MNYTRKQHQEIWCRETKTHEQHTLSTITYTVRHNNIVCNNEIRQHEKLILELIHIPMQWYQR